MFLWFGLSENLTQLVDRLCDCNIAILASTFWRLQKSSWNMQACASVGRITIIYIGYFFFYLTMIWVLFWGWKILALISICFRITYKFQRNHWARGRKGRKTSNMILDSILEYQYTNIVSYQFIYSILQHLAPDNQYRIHSGFLTFGFQGFANCKLL